MIVIRKLLKRFFMSKQPDYYAEENRNPDRRKEYESPSGRYKLVYDHYSTGKSTWAVSRGRVYDSSGEEVADVKRNYPAFPYTWVEDHPDGHDYLVCGSDYQGQTFIRLDTGERFDHLPDAASKGFGFCWAEHHPSPDKTLLAVDGCYWAAPYEVVVYDFRDPMSPPLEITRFSQNFLKWEEDGTLVVHGGWVDVRKSDGVKIDDLPEEEWSEDDDDWDEVPGEETRWTRPSDESIARRFIKESFLWKFDPKWEGDYKKVDRDQLRNARRLLDRLDPEIRVQVEKDMRWSEIEDLPRWD